MKRKAAVIIGVGHTGNLPPLKSAATSADQLKTWLEEEGYELICLTDVPDSDSGKPKPVTAQRVKDAIKKFVTQPPRFHLLLVYFSGHGYWQARADLWLLSGAPMDTDEAINLDGAIDLARYSGIPNVVFVSDACRSIPDSRSGAKVKGTDAFPNFSNITKRSDIDVFRATGEALSAYEAEVSGVSQSLLTYALKSAYEEPTSEMVQEVKEGSKRVKVVPNRKLKNYLQTKINKVLDGINPNLIQEIEATVPSEDHVYISRVRGEVRQLGSWPEPDEAFHKDRLLHSSGTRKGRVLDRLVGEDAAEAIDETLSTRSLNFAGGPLPVMYKETKTRAKTRMPLKEVDHFESYTGFTVHGAKITDAKTTRGFDNAAIDILDYGDGKGKPAVLRLWDVRPSVSVAIRLEDGKCAILVGLFGYIGHATFGEQGLSNVSYIPSSNHGRWNMYKSKRVELDHLRALVSLAVEHNTFKVDSEKEAIELAQRIRVMKTIDPTLGLYAAHAFSQAGLENHILSVRDFMRSDLGADLFDLYVLGSRRKQEKQLDYPLASFCPMLTQTWNLLRPRGIKLPQPLLKASSYLCNSLWTTFNGEGADMIMQAMEKGKLL